MNDLTLITQPTRWASPPEMFSYSALKRMKTCLRGDQLQRSSYGPHHKYPQRPGTPLFYGNLTHTVLEALFKALIRAGLPDRRDPAFAQVMRQVQPVALIKQELDAARRQLENHPRGHGVTLNRTASQLYGEVSVLFQRQYAHAQSRRDAFGPLHRRAPSINPDLSHHDPLELLNTHGALAELKVVHPDLPFLGVIDALVKTPQGTLLADFKTGKVYPDHIDQLALYTLVWWRMTGDLPIASEVIYFHKSQRHVFTAEALIQRERALKADIDTIRQGLSTHHAPATPGEHCARCDVRQLCDPYWARLSQAPPPEKPQDFELLVSHLRDEHGFIGLRHDGTEATVVFHPRARIHRRQLRVGRRVRLLQARQNDEGIIEVAPWSEMFWLPVTTPSQAL